MVKLPRRAALIALAVSVPVLAGQIEIGQPVLIGKAHVYSDRKEIQENDLSTTQRLALCRWLETHQSGWRAMLTERSTEPTELYFELIHADGKTTRLAVIAGVDGRRYALLTGPEQWAYRSYSGLIKSWAAVRNLQPPEIEELRSLATP